MISVLECKRVHNYRFLSSDMSCLLKIHEDIINAINITTLELIITKHIFKLQIVINTSIRTFN
jgi:hypothetical protein